MCYDYFNLNKTVLLKFGHDFNIAGEKFKFYISEIATNVLHVSIFWTFKRIKTWKQVTMSEKLSLGPSYLYPYPGTFN